jgi:hypothetical protein
MGMCLFAEVLTGNLLTSGVEEAGPEYVQISGTV